MQEQLNLEPDQHTVLIAEPLVKNTEKRLKLVKLLFE